MRRDGRGRSVQTTERIRIEGDIEERHVTTTYRRSGEASVITRWRSTSSDTVVRWMRYDSLGRMVLNVEPSTSKNFSPDPSTATPNVPTSGSDLRAWRYAYSDAGDLVGTSDARGCGADFYYDGAGRLVAEDFSPCTGSHATYSTPNLSTGEGTEALYVYGTTAPAKGRLVTVQDRGAESTSTYDYRGRVTAIDRRLAKPGVPDDDPAVRYAPRVYSQSTAYDGADRPTTQSTGVVVAELLASDSTSTVTSVYSRRGTIRVVDSAYGALVMRVVHDADGKTVYTKYGDRIRCTDHVLPRPWREPQTAAA